MNLESSRTGWLIAGVAAALAMIGSFVPLARSDATLKVLWNDFNGTAAPFLHAHRRMILIVSIVLLSGSLAFPVLEAFVSEGKTATLYSYSFPLNQRLFLRLESGTRYVTGGWLRGILVASLSLLIVQLTSTVPRFLRKFSAALACIMLPLALFTVLALTISVAFNELPYRISIRLGFVLSMTGLILAILISLAEIQRAPTTDSSALH